MANDLINIKEDASPSKKLASQSFLRGPDTVHQEEVVLGDGTNNGRVVAVTATNALKVDGSAVNQPVTDAGGALTVDAIDLDIRNLATGQDKVDVRIRDAADATFIDPVIKAQLPAALVGGRLDENVGAWLGSTAPTVGSKTSANSVPVVIASDQAGVPVTDNAGTLTVDAPVGTPVFARLSDGAAALVGQKTMALSLPVALASDQSVLPAVSEIRASTLLVTATAAVNTASTCTLPAAGAGLFHYITHVELVKLYSVVGIAAASGVIITSTNLPGNPSWTTEQAVGAQGTAPKVILYVPTTPLKSSVANTATTFVAPLQLQTIWRWNVSYFTAV